MTMVRRCAPDAEPGIALTPVEMQILDRMVPDQAADRATRPTLSTYLTKLARLGGYLARGKDPPPGNTVMWRGMTRLADIKLGVEIAGTNCG